MKEDKNLQVAKAVFNSANESFATPAVLAAHVEAGYLSALDVYTYLKKLEFYTKAALARIQDQATNEGAGMSEEKYNGCFVTETKAPTRYEFSPVVKDLEKKVKARKDLEKQAYNAYKNGNTIVDDAGEVIPPAKATEGKQTLSIKVPK